MPNRLADETSPYLLQHAHNPVDWYPWGPEALAQAAALDRPILLSIGYSACHWCHVMERESFEDPATAAVMNDHFVNIKVDREERPDLDELYMRAVQAFTGGHGGWPMTVILTPDGKPFFGGTYFPPTARQGMPGFRDVLTHASEMYRQRRDDIDEVTAELVAYLEESGRLPGPADALSETWLEAITVQLQAAFDAEQGGFGTRPKFPPHGSVAVLLAAWQRLGHAPARDMALKTLDGMAKGGMYDLLGGGFARYSVDERWAVPHFEKMLYDNGQLVPLYVDAWKLTENPHYARVVRQTIGYALRELQLPGGAFAASHDADSEGVEGKFFAWTPAQLREVLGLADGLRTAALLGVTDAGSFEHGTSVLRMEQPLESLDEADQALLARALPALFEARCARVAPGRDDKVVTAWNGLMIGALARAGAALGEASYVDAAVRAATFILEQVVVDGRLQRTWKDGRARLPAYLDDHAVLCDALVELHQATLDPVWLEAAVQLADELVRLFWDADQGGFFYTGSDAEALVTRSKNMLGGAEPSGNGVAALALSKLQTLTGREDFGEKADRVLRSYESLVGRAPRALGAEAIAASWRTGRVAEIAIIGALDAPETQALLAQVRQRHLPFAVLAHRAPDDDAPDVLPWLADKPQVHGVPTAYVCEGWRCLAPTTDPAELGAQLDALVAPPAPEDRPKPTRMHAPELPADPALWLNTAAPLTLDRLAGQIVVLDFWTYCCINCMHVLPELAAVEQQFAGQPVAIIGVHSAKFPTEKERDSVARAVSRHRIKHPVIVDSEHVLWSQYAVRSWPTVTVLDSTGRVAFQAPGEVDRETLATVIQELLDEGAAEGTLAEPVWQVPDASPVDAALTSPATDGLALRHPGKVHVFPSAAAQTMGAKALDGDGRLYVADTGHDRIIECVLGKGPDGWPTATLLRSFGDGTPGLADGDADEARFHGPQGMARAGQTLWVADTENHAIRSIDLESGAVATVAGTGQRGTGEAADPSTPLAHPLRSPWDVDVICQGGAPPSPESPGTADVVLIAMAGMHQIWVYLPERGHVGPFIGSGAEAHVDGEPSQAALAQPSGLCMFGRYLFFADSETSSVRAFDLAERSLGTVVGAGLFDFGDVDGVGAEVRLQHPLDLSYADAHLWVADTFNHKVKKIALDGGLTTNVAGGPGLLAEPGGIEVADDFLVVADTNHHRLRVLHRATGELRDLAIELPS